MRSRLFLTLLALALPLAIASRAEAQAVSISTCTGAVTATWSVGIKSPLDGHFDTVTPAQVSTLLGQAECLCDSNDLYARAQITSTTLAQGAAEGFNVWTGAECNVVASQPDVCEQINPEVGLGDFVMGAANTFPAQQIPVRAIVDPAVLNASVSHSCAPSQPTNALWFLFYPPASPATPDYCQVNLPADTLPPLSPPSVSAGSGDGAVTVNWTAPPVGTVLQPLFYQVLCADSKGNPLPNQGGYSQEQVSQPAGSHILGYSTCTNNGLQRRRLSINGGSATATADGGVITTVDMLPAPESSDPLGNDSLHLTDDRLGPSDDTVDMSTPDGGVSGEYTQGPPGSKLFPYLDKKFVCSDILPANSVSYRIDGLTNGETYSFVVVGIDGFGNTGPSEVATGIPRPVEDLYRRCLDEGCKPQGFCFIATAAYGSYQSPYVKVLRDFRDQALLPHVLGRAFVDWYYRTSPPYADYIAAHDFLRFLVRQALWPVIGAAGLWLLLAGWQQILLGLALAAWASRRRLARALFSSVTAR